jgi:hypothetical protein
MKCPEGAIHIHHLQCFWFMVSVPMSPTRATNQTHSGANQPEGRHRGGWWSDILSAQAAKPPKKNAASDKDIRDWQKNQCFWSRTSRNTK